jgi:hypothetical protein
MRNLAKSMRTRLNSELRSFASQSFDVVDRIAASAPSPRPGTARNSGQLPAIWFAVLAPATS